MTIQSLLRSTRALDSFIQYFTYCVGGNINAVLELKENYP